MVLRLAMDINKVDINKVVMSGETSYDDEKSYQYCISYIVNHIVKVLCIMLTQMSGHIKFFDSDS